MYALDERLGACGSLRFFLLPEPEAEEELVGEEVLLAREEAEGRAMNEPMDGVWVGGVEKAEAEEDVCGVGDWDGNDDAGSDDSVVL